jgi:hypothetical protein
MEIIESEVIALAKAEILELAYSISKKINTDLRRDEQITAGQLCSLVRVLETSDSLLTVQQREQIVQGLISIGNLSI